MYCHNCGKEIKEGDRFCTFCGSMLSEETPQPETLQQAETEPVRETVPQPETTYKPEPVPHYKKGTGLIVGVVTAVGAIIISALFVVLSVTALNAAKKLENSNYWNEYNDSWEDDAYPNQDYDPMDDFF